MKKLTTLEIQELNRLREIPQENRTEVQRARYKELLTRLLDEKLVAWPNDVKEEI